MRLKITVVHGWDAFKVFCLQSARSLLKMREAPHSLGKRVL